MKRIGLDIGSTTVKCVVLDEKNNILYSDYKRHMSKSAELCAQMLRKIATMWQGEEMKLAISGSAGMGVSEQLSLPFVQEVYATKTAADKFAPGTDVVIELGGEDAKIIFLTDGFEMRMNGSCAGGTGAFIDQMSSLMNITPDELGELASKHESVCSIASRCGVFAKSDIQPLLNQGARREDVAAGILYAVVNQTVAGLSQGREIKGNILYLGGPLSFIPELRVCFDDVLKTKGKLPENSLYYVAIGAAMSLLSKEYDIGKLASTIENEKPRRSFGKCSPLFENEEEYKEFLKRHNERENFTKELEKPSEDGMFLGIDAGSTTVKALLCDKEGNILFPLYKPGNGNPVPIIREYLTALYEKYPDIKILSFAVTGYGEELIRHAFGADMGIVETVAHYTAAKHIKPDVDFILDIGGQDIKCFCIRSGAIDSIYLNEACSSGCGSFLQTFAATMGYSSEEFFKLGLYSKAPVDLGSRCTIFMNSSVKQAQKDGASVEDISAGLSISVVKNALYKVIRCASPDSLGKNIVVQGGTFLNDAVLRAFEKEINREVIRPKTAPLMGAYGAALYALEKYDKNKKSTVITKEGLQNFVHTTKAITCKGCTNSCKLTVNTFANGEKYIAGNRCERPLGNGEKLSLNLYEYKRKLLSKYRKNTRTSGRSSIGIPMGLNMFELLPFWHSFWSTLGFDVVVSPDSTRALYTSGQHTIPSDIACYPAKLMHGHIEALLSEHTDAIFYPDMTYNTEEGLGVNHYNCPVVAYYPQVIKHNVKRLKDTVFIDDFISLHNKKQFRIHIEKIVAKYFPDIKKTDIKKASDAAFAEYEAYFTELRKKGDEYMQNAFENKIPLVVLCGRPYHIDNEICHGIDSLICSLGAAVITEDSVCNKVSPFPVDVMNQWTYHSRLYAAAKYVSERQNENIQLIQLVSFGCGIDAVTTDEVRSIIENSGKLYTQLKIDEISNMGAIKIRLRSLIAATENR